jgi:hypothetical protein
MHGGWARIFSAFHDSKLASTGFIAVAEFAFRPRSKRFPPTVSTLIESVSQSHQQRAIALLHS